jgi:leucyl-tRNA synthetase
MGYGEGAVMGVPAHDERDFAFAKKYGLPIRQVIAVPGKTYSTDAWEEWYADKENGVCVNSGKYDGLNHKDATNAIAADLKAKDLGDKQVQWRLRDWGISRQRYWGTPVPIIHCPACGDVPVPDRDLPVVLPEDCVPDGSGNPLGRRTAFLDVACPKCGKPARRETDTMDTFVDSSWYFSRFASPDADRAMVDDRVNYWLPVDQYIGGIEHAILHLLYARFWSKVMRDLGLVTFDEPFSNLLTQGMVLNHIFSRKTDKGGVVYFAPEEVEVQTDADGKVVGARSRADGAPVEYGGVGTMSKSKRNGVDPQELIDRYGADTARFFIIFTSPPEQTLEWNDAGVEGASRFLKRMWAYGSQWASSVREISTIRAGRFDGYEFPADLARATPHVAKLRREIHSNLKQATYDMGRMQFNTVASAAMKMLNALQEAGSSALDAPETTRGMFHLAQHEGLSILLRVLYPITPHIAHGLWRELAFAGDPMGASWPDVDAAALETDEIELVLQVNGKLRGHLRVPKAADKAAVESAALAHEAVQRHASGQPPRRVVVVPGKLVNVVL